MTSLLLDEMFGGHVAEQLRFKGHDVLAVVADPPLVALPDSAILAHATAAGRAVVTRNIRDFVALDAEYQAAGSLHGGLVLVSVKTFPEGHRTEGALVRALDKLLSDGGVGPGCLAFLQS